jgi:PAS domain-containing protein
MTDSRMRTSDPVMEFLRDMRRTARTHTERLDTLAITREAATRRLTGLGQTLDAAVLVNVIDEMTLRDEELKATTDELREQIDSLRRASALLERERCKYIDLFERAPEAYIVTDMAGTIDEANLAASTLFRTEPSFLAGRPLITFVARNDTRAFRSFLTQMQSLDRGDEGSARQVMLRMRPRGHAVFVVFARAAPVTGETGKLIAIRWILRPFDFEEADAGKGAAVADLAAALAEDLREPLLPIASWARSLREEGARDEAEAQQALAWIEKSACAQQTKLDELTEFAHAQRERGEATVTDLADDVERAVRAEGGEWSRVVVERRVGPGEARVVGQGMQRAVELLLQRALEGTPRTSQVQVRIQMQGPDVLVDIAADESALVPAGWAVRTATATRLVERCGGRLTVTDPSPSVRLRFRRIDP